METGKFRRKAIQVPDAQQTIWNHIRPLETVEKPLIEAMGYRLAETIRTPHPIPHFRRAGMDGYAVRSDDVRQTPVELRVLEAIPCGKQPIYPITSGTASRIMTGGMVPEGADAVVMLEVTEEVVRRQQSYVTIRKFDSRRTNITPIGEEADTGTVLLEKGEWIEAGQMAILAALGCSRVPVYRKPKVRILSTGTELLRVTDSLRPGQIRNSNGYMLAAQVRSAGAEPDLVEPVPDENERVESLLAESLSSDADLVITTGGVSVGDYDVMADFFTHWEGKTLFNKVAMRPGSPTSVGLWNDRWIFGLSGNPSACFVGFELFVRPALLGMQGGSPDESKKWTACLSTDYKKVNAFTRFVRGVRTIENGRMYVKPVGLDRSSALVTLKDADCLIVIPPTKTGIKAGEIVTILPLPSSI